MRRGILTVFMLLCFTLLLAASGHSEEVYYARCNLKVVKGTISWVNWQHTNEWIPVGTELKVTYKDGDEATFEDAKSGKRYSVELGAKGQQYLEKFVTRKKPATGNIHKDARDGISKGIIKVGMNKAEAYIAMGPPANVDRTNSDKMTYDDIIKGSLWVYKRSRFGKNIGVEFGDDGIVKRTEGIWVR